MKSHLTCLMLIAAFVMCGCKKEQLYEPRDNTGERAAFEERFNKETIERLEKEKKQYEEALAGDLTEADRREKERLLGDLEERFKRPNYFERYTEEDLPKGLVWEDGMDQPEIGSDEAKKGGTFHAYFIDGAYPPTLRSCGAQANNSFRGYHWDEVEMGLIDLHLNTGQIIPGLADRWAVGENGRDVYFHIDKEARWSDGRKVTSEDWMMAFYIYLSPYLTETFYRIYFADQFWGIASYGPDYICIRNAYPKPMAPYYAGDIIPYQTEFYKEFGPDFEERYNWRPRPMTGPYIFKEEDIKKGVSIAQTRVKDWWAKDKKYYKNRFNVDRIEFKLIRAEEKQFQMFVRGDLDFYLLDGSQSWYEKSEVDEVFKGYIERATFFYGYPRPSFGLYINTIRGQLSNQDVRIGLAYATNWEKYIKIEQRGDADRLRIMFAGYDEISNPNIEPRMYSVTNAREAFARAGFTKAGKDGVLMNEDGKRLSFTITTVNRPSVEVMMRRLKEEALKAGVEYKIELLDSQASFLKVNKKEHEIYFGGWAISPPVPSYYEYMHSKEAFVPGTRKPLTMTNNVMSFADPEVDPILEANRNARSMQDIIDTSHALEQVIYDRAIFIPAYVRPYYRLGYWRWVRWPDDFNVKQASYPQDAHVQWIDEDIKAETLEAMKSGISFGEKNLVFDQYRDKPINHNNPKEEEAIPEDGSDAPNQEEPEGVSEPVIEEEGVDE